jgi:hypothetical protein
MEPRPAEPVLLNYARPEPPAAVKSTWPVCVLLCLGIGAFFAPLDRRTSPLDVSQEVLDSLRNSIALGMYPRGLQGGLQGAIIVLPLASAFPLLLLAAIPGRFPRLMGPVATVAITLGLLSAAGMPLRWLRGPGILSLVASVAVLCIGVGLIIYALTRHREIHCLAWLTLATPHLAMLGLLLCLPEILRRPGPGFWLYLAYVPVVVVQTVRVMLHGPPGR